jgi:hypothetical protein
VNISVTPCEYARERHQNLAKWRNLWTILLFAFGSAVILFLAIAVIFFLRQSWLTGAVSALGTMANGVAVKWVVDRRAEAVKEEEDAYKDVESKCGNTKEADVTRTKQMLFGTIR